MFSKRHVVGIAAALLLLLFLLKITTGGVRIRAADLPVQTEGPKIPVLANQPTDRSHPESLRTWAFQGPDQAGGGSVRLGPFPASARLTFLTRGHPNESGHTLYLDMAGLGLRFPLAVKNTSEAWHLESFDIPFGWQGREVFLVLTTEGSNTTAEAGMSEPLFAQSQAVFEFGFVNTLAGFVFTGLLLMFSFWAIAQWLTRLNVLPPWWIGLAAGAVLAVVGYGAFWAYFAHPLAGKIYSAVCLTLGAVLWCRAPAVEKPRDQEWPALLVISLGVGCLYFAVLFALKTDRDFYDMAANHMVVGLPGDNRFPHDVATLIYHGLSPKHPGGDWLSSDRPPLQCGWQLLTWPFAQAFGFGESTASGVSGVWLQLLWIPAVYGLFRAFGLRRSRSCAWVIVTALNGFCFSSTVYTWPKLCAGAFGCGAVGLWFLSTEGSRRGRFVMGGVMAGLAILSHGSVAFSFIALIPFALFSVFRGNLLNWILAAGVVASLYVPWMAYQKFYEPPGNRLVKWHLGGQVPIDSRGTWQTIRENYAAKSSAAIKATKLESFRMLGAVDWPSLAMRSAQGAERRRVDEFNHVGRSVGLCLILGLAALPIILLSPKKRADFSRRFRPQLFCLSWTVSTLIVWCLLLFEPAAAIFLGSYSVLLTSLALFSTWADAAGKYALPVTGVLAGLLFFSTWLPDGGAAGARWSFTALGCALAVGTGLIVFIVRALSAEVETGPRTTAPI